MARLIKARVGLWLLSIRDGFVSLLPLTLFGVAATLLQHFPLPLYQSFVSGLFGGAWQDYLAQIVRASHGVLGMALSVAVSVHITTRLPRVGAEDSNLPPIMVALATLVNFMICSLHLQQYQDALGYEAMLLGIVVGIASAELLRWAIRQKWLSVLRIPHDADQTLHHALRLCLPVALIGSVVLCAATLLKEISISSHFFAQFAAWAHSLPFGDLVTTTLVSLVNHLSWFVGVHGGHILDSYASDLFVSAGLPMDGHLAWRPLFDSFVLMGGAGSTLGLVIAIWIAAPGSSQRRIAQLGLLPSLFNINEIILFGLPVVLSPVYFLPFIAVPCILGLLSVGAVHAGLIELQSTTIPWTTPPLISGWYLSGSWRGAALQLVLIAISVALYLPFVRRAEAARERRQSALLQRTIDTISAEMPARQMVIRRQDEVGMMARALLEALRSDIRGEGLFLCYQPKHDRAGRLVGLEALLRWKSARYGVIPTPVAINLSEDGAYIRQLGDWVLEESCACKARWNALGHAGLSLAVNVSPSQLEDTGFARRLETTLRRHRLASSEIEIEITESQAIPDEANTNACLAALADLGVHLSMDDFGMGYSSLLHLRRFRIHSIKIDGSLTRDVLSNKTNAEIIRAITSLGMSCQVEIVAEFIETLAQRDALAEMGCDVFQGYYHSPPLTESECLAYFERHLTGADRR